MTSPLVLFRSGAEGLPTPSPVDFATLAPPGSPNRCLAAPAWHAVGRDIETPLYPVSPARLYEAVSRLAAGLPRVHRLGDWPERHQAQWVERSSPMNFPDIIAAEAVVAPQGGAGLFLYSHSVFGYSDFGVNRARVARWLAALAGAV